MKRNGIKILFCTAILLSGCSCVLANSEVELGSDVLNTLTATTRIMLLIGAFVCVAKLIQIGILYVTSSAADKSNAKMAILPWLIGTFVCFGAATLGGYVIRLLQITRDVLNY